MLCTESSCVFRKGNWTGKMTQWVKHIDVNIRSVSCGHGAPLQFQPLKVETRDPHIKLAITASHIISVNPSLNE